jgi:hypothetical protein
VSVIFGDHPEDVPLGTRYITVLYFFIATLVGAGFGDYTPVNDWERGFVIIVLTMGSVCHAIVFANIAAQVEGFSRDRCVAKGGREEVVGEPP